MGSAGGTEVSQGALGGRPDAVEEGFFADLRRLGELRRAHPDVWSDRFAARTIGVSPQTVGDWLIRKRFPQNRENFVELMKLFRKVFLDGGVQVSEADARLLSEEWEERWEAVARVRVERIKERVNGGRAAAALAAAEGSAAASASGPRAAVVPGPAAEDAAHEPASTLDFVAALEEAVPRWGTYFQTMNRAIDEMADASRAVAEDLNLERLDLQSGAGVAKLAVLRRYADLLSEPTSTFAANAGGFADEVHRLDPEALAVIGVAEGGDGPQEDLVEYACEIVLVITPRLRQNFRVIKRDEESIGRLAGVSQVMRPAIGRVTEGMARITEAFGRVEEWERRILATGRARPHLPGLDDEEGR